MENQSNRETYVFPQETERKGRSGLMVFYGFLVEPLLFRKILTKNALGYDWKKKLRVLAGINPGFL
jgi:hypothetical protein